MTADVSVTAYVSVTDRFCGWAQDGRSRDILSYRYYQGREPLIPLEIQHPGYGGAFATTTGEPLSFVLPGEAVETDPFRILTPSRHRVDPRCIHFGVCGGCQYQHADYPAQLAFKGQILQNIFAQADLRDLPTATLHHAHPWEYRNRIRLRVQASAAGIELGYSRRASNEFLPIRMCPIAAPLLWRAASALIESASEPVALRWFASVAEVELFMTPDEARLQVVFFLQNSEGARREPELLRQLCDRLQRLIPEMAGAGATLAPELSRRERRKSRWDGAAWGVDGLAYPAAGRTYWVSRGAFFQVNRFLVDGLVTLVTASQSGALAWDLFAGVGLFTRPLADRFTHVIAVEAGDTAAGDLAMAARSETSPAYEAVHAPVLDFLRAREHQRDRPDLVVLDPPRAGLGLEAAAILARIGAARIVYVSCDPLTLARDLALLTRSYRVESIDLIDLFPQTFHMESIVHLHRRV